MEIMEKLRILSDAAKYDVSCSSSGSRRKNIGGIGNGAVSGICHSWSADGRCISLLKILMTNSCIYDCEYCVNRCSHDIPRVSFSPEEVVSLTIEFYRRNYIEGLFLSSGILRSPDYTTELFIKIAKKLRLEEQFGGYIHMKGIPGTDEKLIRELGLYIDRFSVNMELPSEAGLKRLAPQKTKQTILLPMRTARLGILEQQEEKKKRIRMPEFIPAGQTTQLIVGATPERDRQIVKLTEALYQKVALKRVYYSAYVPVMTGKNLPAAAAPPLLRENRLYQADWLLRFYGFSADEILSEEQPDFDLELDPKAGWALRHRECFPIEVNRASYRMLLRVPGIGVLSAKRIYMARKMAPVTPESLKRMGIVWKKARHFITCSGRYYGLRRENEAAVRHVLMSGGKWGAKTRQMSLFEGLA